MNSQKPPELPHRNSKTKKKQQELTRLPFYWPEFRTQAEVSDKMEQHINESGSFLVRNSISRPGVLTVSVAHSNSVKHFKIEENHDDPSKIIYFLEVHYQFYDIKSLIEHYKTYPVPNLDNVRNVLLLHPIIRPKPRSKSFCTSAQRSASVNALFHPPEGMTSTSTRVENWVAEVNDSIFTQSHPPEQRRMTINEQRPIDMSLIQQTQLKKNHSFSSSRDSTLRLKQFDDDFSLTKPKVNFDRNPSVQVSPSRPKGQPEVDEIQEAFNRNFSPEMQRRASVDNRPQQPLPPETSDYGGLYYSRVQPHQNRTDELIRALRLQDSREQCKCGLLTSESEVAGGWTIHIDHDGTPSPRLSRPERRRLFFQSPDEVPKTSWSLPEMIICQMESEDWMRLIGIADKIKSEPDKKDFITLRSKQQRLKLQSSSFNSISRINVKHNISIGPLETGQTLEKQKLLPRSNSQQHESLAIAPQPVSETELKQPNSTNPVKTPPTYPVEYKPALKSTVVIHHNPSTQLQKDSLPKQVTDSGEKLSDFEQSNHNPVVQETGKSSSKGDEEKVECFV